MVGAGLIALVQSVVSIYQSSSKNKKSVNKEEESFTASASQTRKTLVVALLTHLAGGVFVGIICGAFTGMPLPKMIRLDSSCFRCVHGYHWKSRHVFRVVPGICGYDNIYDDRRYHGVPANRSGCTDRIYQFCRTLLC